MFRPRLSFTLPALVGLGALLLGVALLCAPAWGDEPVAQVSGLEAGPLLDLVRQTVGTTDAAPTSVFDARRRAEQGRDRALAALRSEGYYGARATARVEPGARPSAHVDIEAGDRFMLGAVRIEVEGSTDSGPAKVAASAAALTSGKPARAESVITAETRAVAAVESQGFPDAHALDRTVVVDHARKEMDVTLNIDTGRPVVLGQVRAKGTARLRQDYLTEVASFKPGQVYDRRALDTLANRLRETGAFKSVNVQLAESAGPGEGPETRDVIVDATATKRRLVTLGASYSTSEGAGVETSWTRRNVFGGAESLTVDAAVEGIEQHLGVELDSPNWRRPGRTLRLSAIAKAENTDAYDRDGVDLKALLETKLSERLSRATGIGATVATVNDGTTRQTFKLVYATGSFAWDGADQPLDPRSGARTSASLRPTAGYGDGDPLAYLTAQAAASAYQPLGDHFTFAVRGHLGSIFGPALTKIPADERFYAGGGGSIRGYEYQAVSPRDANGKLVGGRSLVELSGELRYHGKGKLGYVAFIDGGAASNGTLPNTSEVRWGAGVGVRYFTGFGPIRADIATPIDQRKGEPAVQAYFSIGQAF
jgi:translocation and assembly module TamA